VVPEAITFAIVLSYWGYWSYIKAKKRSAIESEGTKNPTSIQNLKLWVAFVKPLMLSRRKNIERLPQMEAAETVNFSQIRRKPLRARVPRSDRKSEGPEGNASVSKMV
jgi:hypothetical protein